MALPQTPLLATDIIIQLMDQPSRPIVLIERKNKPYGWAIPGGFVDVGETVERAAVREALEETCLPVELIVLLGLYSDPDRDSRGHTVTATYVAQSRGTPHAADDALSTVMVEVDQLPEVLVFDHDMMLRDYLRWRNEQQVAPIRHVF